jgi:tetratricopeptide (TPR) repeat protein
MPPDLDPVASVRRLLAEGRYQEVLDRHLTQIERGLDPSVGLAVATAATRLGRYGEGQRFADASYSAFRRRADDDGQLRSLNLLGAISYETGAVDLATDYWTRALDLARALGDALMIGRTSNNLAITSYYAGKTTEANSGYREAMVAYQRLGDRRGIAEALHNLAIIRRAEGAPSEAADLGFEAVRHAESVGDPVLLALSLTGRAESLVELGNYGVADGLLRRAENLSAEASDAPGTAEATRVRAEMALRMGDSRTALQLAEHGYQVAQQHASRLLQGECATLASRALEQLGRNEESARYREEAREIFTALGAVPWLQKLPT